MPPIPRLLLVQAIRYLVALQAFGMVVLHAGWMLLAIATWGAAGDADVTSLARLLTRAFVWLGGVDASGHGDEGTIFAVWGKISIVVWLLGAAWRALRGPRPPWSAWKVVVLSGAIALAGYAFAIWPAEDGNLAAGAWVLAGMTIATTVATAWAVASARIGEWVIAQVERAALAKAGTASARGT
jgi:hypothetical protein